MAHGEATCWRVMVPAYPRVGQAVDLGGGFGIDGENQGHDINVDESNEEVIILTMNVVGRYTFCAVLC